jgi:hypothetical protein
VLPMCPVRNVTYVSGRSHLKCVKYEGRSKTAPYREVSQI